MNIWHLVFRVDSLTYTIAKALSHGGRQVCIWLVEPDQDYGLSEGIYTALRETPGVSFIGKDEARLPTVIDRLIIQSHPRPQESTLEARPLASRARRISLISAGDRSRSWRLALKLQWLEVKRLWRHWNKVDRVLYKDGFYRRDLLGCLKPRSHIGFDVHSQFLHNDELCRAIHARDWDPAARRPILVNFLGCSDPASRARILDAVRPAFGGDGISTSDGIAKQTFWHEYTNASPIGLEPLEFLNVLSRSDFTLCPRGYSLVTHRPIEALLRGSIPVLSSDELDLYGVQLRDSENCVAVPDGQWTEAVRRLASVGERDLVRMRHTIRTMVEVSLDYDALARCVRSRVGIDDSQPEAAQLAARRGAAVAS